MIYFKQTLNDAVSFGEGYVLPAGAAELTLEQYQAECDAALQPATETLAQLKDRLRSLVDAEAEAERLKYITPGVGQSMTYQQKAAEASRYLAATDPDAADYPLLSAEVGITAEDIAGVAAIVDAAFRQWQAIGSAIEAVRLGAKAQITAAADADAANVAYAAISWPA
ncbi:hypothetical protein [Rhizobium sp. BK602]|uniref:hypothetical protein n=1 Tax=Rhizobium sp. BK602 TaxID=2586986 RepID=UPI00161CACB1|nr:hypothetical protein [Rhizobium sp. BK602]MBB3608682.1 hypothetical protein [Rhizobium sp. BK602]